MGLRQGEIQGVIKEYSLSGSGSEEAKRYMDYMRVHLRLTCEYSPGKIIKIIEQIVKLNFYPIEDSLEICE